MTDFEGKCLKECADQQAFVEKMMYELDSANQIAKGMDKAKRGFIF